MWILPLIGYAGVVVGFSFLTLAIASGLYYLSEIVEEHTVLARKTLRILIIGIIALQILLCLVDRFPWKLSLLSIISHIIYSQNLRHFPTVKLTDPMFLLSCCLVLINHYFWFSHFQRPPHKSNDAYHPSRYTSSSFYGSNTDPFLSEGSKDTYHPSFTEISSYFGLCVWLVPFSLFVALSAGENVLPSMGSEYATGDGSSFVTAGSEPGAGGLPGTKNKREGMAKAAVNGVRDMAAQAGSLFGVGGGEKTRRF